MYICSPTIWSDMDNLPVIEGIDVEAAVTAMGGKQETYLETLGNFRREIPSKIENINRTRAEKNTEEFTVLVHGVKGAARLLGINGLADMMYGLEIASKTGDEDYIADRLLPSLNELAGFYEKLEPYDNKRPPEGFRETDAGELGEALIQLRELLDEFEDEAAAAVVEEIGNCVLGVEQRVIYEKLYHAIDRYDYYESIKYADELIETLGK